MAASGGGGRGFVGFGFGPIQAGLMLLEAMDSGSFSRYHVVEIDAALVGAVRANGNAVSVNIARRDGIVKRRLEGIGVLNPRAPSDLAAIRRSVSEADEMATAIPSVAHYGSGGETSVAALIASGVSPDRTQIIYAAENHNFAAELLREDVLKHTSEDRLKGLDILNTVIGKMSGVIQSPDEMEKLGIEPVVPGWTRAILVEEFSRILVERPHRGAARRGIRVFAEKDDLLPFEEAKLYGHNAIHSLLGYLAAQKGYDVMSRIREDRELYELGLAAFLEESGAPLRRRHASLGEELFTERGFEAYARDLMERMTNPWLYDKVERICRDPARKLALGDRLFGTMALALEAGVTPRRLALGAAAAIRYARSRGEKFAGADVEQSLRELWAAATKGAAGTSAAGPAAGPAAGRHADECIRLVEEAERILARGASHP